MYQIVKESNQRQEEMSHSLQGNIYSTNKKAEAKLATIFMGVAVMFLVCHLPRLLLAMHEMATIARANACYRAGYHAFEVWALLMASAR